MSKKSTKRKMRKDAIGTPAGTIPSMAVAPANKPYEFKPDYSYVIKDLRRIAMLAGSFIALLVVLSFFLR